MFFFWFLVYDILPVSQSAKQHGRAGPRPQGAAPRAREHFECSFWFFFLLTIRQSASQPASMALSAREHFESSFWFPVDDNPPASQSAKQHGRAGPCTQGAAPRAREHFEDSLVLPFSDTLPISHPGSL